MLPLVDGRHRVRRNGMMNHGERFGVVGWNKTSFETDKGSGAGVPSNATYKGVEPAFATLRGCCAWVEDEATATPGRKAETGVQHSEAFDAVHGSSVAEGTHEIVFWTSSYSAFISSTTSRTRSSCSVWSEKRVREGARGRREHPGV